MNRTKINFSRRGSGGGSRGGSRGGCKIFENKKITEERQQGCQSIGILMLRIVVKSDLEKSEALRRYWEIKEGDTVGLKGGD